MFRHRPRNGTDSSFHHRPCGVRVPTSPAEGDGIKVADSLTACNDFHSKMQVTAGGLYVLMPHEVHKAVNINLIIPGAVVNALVCCEVVPELMRGQFKRKLICKFRDHVLYCVTGERFSMTTYKEIVRIKRA